MKKVFPIFIFVLIVSLTITTYLFIKSYVPFEMLKEKSVVFSNQKVYSDSDSFLVLKEKTVSDSKAKFNVIVPEGKEYQLIIDRKIVSLNSSNQEATVFLKNGKKDYSIEVRLKDVAGDHKVGTVHIRNQDTAQYLYLEDDGYVKITQDITENGIVPVEMSTNKDMWILATNGSNYSIEKINAANSTIYLQSGAGKYDLNIYNQDNDQVTVTDVHVENQDPNRYLYYGADGAIALTEGNNLLPLHVTFPEKKALINVIKNKDTGEEVSDIWLKNEHPSNLMFLMGSGKYEVITYVTEARIAADEDVEAATKDVGGYSFNVFENEDVDDLAFRLPSYKIQSDDPEIVALAEKLTKGLITDAEKTRAIYSWVTSNIRYDYQLLDWINDHTRYDIDFFHNEVGVFDAKGTLKQKKSVCQGFSNLTVALNRAVGIKAKSVYGKAIDLNAGESFSNPDDAIGHAWNEVFINGEWMIQDPTWDEGANGNFKYFGISLEEFAKDHQTDGVNAF